MDVRAKAGVLVLGLCVLGWWMPSNAVLITPREEFRVVNKLTLHDRLVDIRLAGDQGWAIGDHGVLLMTADGGNSWQRFDVPSRSALLGLDVTSSGHGVIVGQAGTILATVDKGRHWTSVKSDSKARLFSVRLDESGFGLAVGEFGALLRTLDFGKTWLPLAPIWTRLLGNEEIPHLYDVLVEDRHSALVVGEFGVIMRTQNSGRDWTVLRRSDESLFALRKSSRGEYWCLGQSGLLLRSQDRGYKWQTVRVEQRLGLFGMEIDPRGYGILLGTEGLLKTTNGGQAWQSATNLKLPAVQYYAVTLTKDSSYLLAGESGLIVHVDNKTVR